MNKTLKIHTAPPNSQKGFSLLELLLAATLGIFILGGVIFNFMSMSKGEKMRSAISEMDANARAAMIFMRQYIAHTGYSSINNIMIDKPFYSKMDGLSKNLSCGNGINMNSTGNTPGEAQYTRDNNATTTGDVLTIISLADNPCLDLAGNTTCPEANINMDAMVYTDCTGNGLLRDQRATFCSTELMPTPREAKIYSTFYLGLDENSNTNHSLYCKGNRGGEKILVEDIESLQFLYGVTKDDGTTKYLNASEVEAKSSWELVTSVQVGLLMRSSNEFLLESDNEKLKYVLLDNEIQVSDKRRLYRVYTTTISLPNRDKGALL